jgi:hypothetical protein
MCLARDPDTHPVHAHALNWPMVGHWTSAESSFSSIKKYWFGARGRKTRKFRSTKLEIRLPVCVCVCNLFVILCYRMEALAIEYAGELCY